MRDLRHFSMTKKESKAIAAALKSAKPHDTNPNEFEHARWRLAAEFVVNAMSEFSDDFDPNTLRYSAGLPLKLH